MTRLAIGLPCQDQVHAGFALDLARMTGVLGELSDLEYTLIQNRGTIIPQQRATLVRAAQEYQATHILFLDSDMRFPRDLVPRLLSRDEPIVAANYARRRHPVLPTAEHTTQGYLFTPPASAGLVEVTQCGMGVMLIEMRVFDAIAEPWFHLGYTPSTREYVGEDFYFCKRARDAGFQILIDQAISHEIKHAGEMEWTHEHTLITRDAVIPPKPTLELAEA
jgi:hypothetical protein